MSIGTRMQPQRSIGEQELLQLFLDRAIHDLRASSRQIGTSAEALSENLSDSLKVNLDQESSLRRLRDGVSGLNRILTGMSNYAVAVSAANYTLRRVNLKTALSSAISRLGEPISRANATITYRSLPEVSGDADRLSEVFQHLVVNALTYRAAASPLIEVQAKREQELWLISVRDNGIGLEPKYWDHVFAPFYRLHGPAIPGVGMGLAICRRILEAHQGRMWIESEKGSGTTCFFTLLADDDEQAVEY